MEPEKLEIVTNTGFSCVIDESTLNDMELLEDLAAIDKGDLARLPGAVERMLGADQKKALYDHVRAGKRVPIDRVAEELGEIIASLRAKKK